MEKLYKQHGELMFYAFTVAFLGMYVPLLFQLSLYVIALWVWILYRHKEPQKKVITLPTYVAVGALMLIVFTRLVPFLSGHPAPLGYDTGIYKWEFENAFNLLPNFNMGIHPGLFFLGDFLHIFTGMNANTLMTYGFILFNLFIPLTLYVVVKEQWGKTPAIISMILFVLSSIQFQAYTYVLYKNVVGISILLLALLLIEKRSYWLLPIGIFLAMLQPTHFAILGLTIFIMWIINIKKPRERKYLFINGIVLLAGSIGVFSMNTGLLASAWDVILKKDAIADGVFIQLTEGINLATFYIPFALVGICATIRQKINKSFVVFTAIIAVIIALKLFFNKRYLIELDTGMILFAGVGIAVLLPKILKEASLKTVFAVIVISLVLLNIQKIAVYKPQISKQEFISIQNLCHTTQPNAIIMATHSLYSAWLRGFSCRDVFAPGLFELNTWSQADWDTFWFAPKQEREKFMEEKYPYKDRPLYIFVGEQQQQMNFSDTKGFSQINPHLWKWNLQ